MLIVAFTVLGAFLVVGVPLTLRAVAFNDAVSTQPALSMRAFGPLSPDRVNILLLGFNDESHGGGFLSDSINILHIDKATNTTTIIPLPRDLWVEGVPEVPQNMKLNEAFRIGRYADGFVNAGDLSAEAATVATGLPIDGWIALEFQGLEAIVDAVGGITVDNPTAFSYTWAEEDYLAGSFESAFPSGTLVLNGNQALDYARSRYTSVAAESSDFSRSMRQERVLTAIRAKLDGWQAVTSGLNVADAISEHVHTNLSVLDLAMLIAHLTPDRRLELAEGEILEATTNTIGQYVLAVIGRAASDDYGELHEWIADKLAAGP